MQSRTKMLLYGGILNHRNHMNYSKATNHGCHLPGPINCQMSRFPLMAKIRPAAPLSSSVNPLQGPPVNLKHASVLQALTAMLTAPLSVFIPVDPDFDRQEQETCPLCLWSIDTKILVTEKNMRKFKCSARNSHAPGLIWT